MKAILLVSTALAGLMLASTAFAQTATGTGTSNSTSNSGSTSGAVGVVGPDSNNVNNGNSNARANSNSNANTRSSSRSQSSGNANAQNIQFNTPGNTTSTNTNTNNGSTSSNNTSNNNNRDNFSGGTSNSNYNQQGGYTSSDNIVRTTPTVYAPPVSGGNPCTLAVSGGVSVIGWGAAAGGTFVDEDCANRQKIAMIHNAGYAQVAFELMCNDRATYNAAKTAGKPCAYRQQFEAPGAPAQPMQPVTQPVPTPIGPPPVVRTSTVIKDSSNLPRCSRTITDNCYGG